jgi:hypothetical protein
MIPNGRKQVESWDSREVQVSSSKAPLALPDPFNDRFATSPLSTYSDPDRISPLRPGESPGSYDRLSNPHASSSSRNPSGDDDFRSPPYEFKTYRLVGKLVNTANLIVTL